ncbi:oligoribonuclease [Ornithinibacillus massiliensis]|uniref:Oligoribonuclease n=1 Tax=Ornithinibacillus massiliensis TaxID=1944633 RepID=A0ABS5MDX3_9BACI|nr:oligoribonuclease [Ornithinibacillus massiliensis]MBS3680278.1 oligoribonuclease [Ornithinibacillus massiliensis]
MYKLLSHNDLDGVGCGILAKLAFGKQVQVRFNSVGGLDREVAWFLDSGNMDTYLFITDLSVNEENEKRLEQFYQSGGKLRLIDHHKTALHFNAYNWGHVIVENENGNLNSATSLFYEFLVKEGYLEAKPAIDEFVELVRQYDTWEWEKNENHEAHRLNALFYLVSIDEFEEKMIERLQDNEHFFFDDFEKKILVMEDDKIERYIRRKRRELIQHKVGDHYAGVVFAESYHSELGNELGKGCPHLDYIAIVNIGSRRMGFRTIHDHIDVAEIASEYGGGGHAKASGCTMTEAVYRSFVEETFQLEPLREDAKRNRYNVKGNSFGTLYSSKSESLYLLYQENDSWFLEHNHQKLSESFSNFIDAENYLKRNYEAWLVRDDQFVHYLIEKVKRS